jgi:hypothetical protein
MATIEIWNSNFPTPDTLVGRAVFNVNDELADMEPESEEEEEEADEEKQVSMYGYIRVAIDGHKRSGACNSQQGSFIHDMFQCCQHPRTCIK